MNFYKHIEVTQHGAITISVSEKLLRIREFPIWEKRMKERFPEKDRTFEKFIKEYSIINGAIVDNGKEDDIMVSGC